MGIADRLGGASGSTLFSSEAPALNFSRGDTAPSDPRPVAGKALKRNQYPGHCVDCGTWIEAQAGLLTKTAEGKWGVKHDQLSVCAKAADAAPRGTGIASTGLDLRTLPEGRYGVPNSESRLKVLVEKPNQGNWAGWIFVKDAAEYGPGQRYGSQKPQGTYRGKIEAELAAILADPRAAAARYGQLTSHCGMCGRVLEDQESIDRGIGPVCSKRYFG